MLLRLDCIMCALDEGTRARMGRGRGRSSAQGLSQA